MTSSVFRNLFFTKAQKASNFRARIHNFEGKESNDDKNTELASTVDLENPDPLPVKEVYEGMMIGSQLLS